MPVVAKPFPAALGHPFAVPRIENYLNSKLGRDLSERKKDRKTERQKHRNTE